MQVWWRCSPVLFWISSVLLLPLLAWQGRAARRDTLRLPEASGPSSGQWGEGEACHRFLVLGESTAAGVGVEQHHQGLASQLARALHEQDARSYAWYTCGRNGARLADLLDGLAEMDLPAADTVLLSMGVNDTTGLTRLGQYRKRLLLLRDALQSRYRQPLVLLAVPPMHRFSALPMLLRLMLGWRARQLDQLKRDLAVRHPEAFRYIGYPSMTDPAMLARDGYHPGEAGYRAMAEALARVFSGEGNQRPLNTA